MKNIKHVILLNFFAPLQETFADAGNGNGRGGKKDRYLFHPSPNIGCLLFIQCFIDASSWSFSDTNHRFSPNIRFLFVCPPGRRLLLTQGMGIGETNRGKYLYHHPIELEKQINKSIARNLIYIYIVSKFPMRHWDQDSNANVN